jgi:single-strand DNA-binding protein
MADLNKVMILGNVGRDPEIRYTAQGNELTTFTVAANRNYRKPDGEWGQETEWFNIVTWGELARRMAQNLQKGDRVYGEWGQETEWFNIVTWGELARRMAQNLQKGDRVYVEGRLQTRSWEGPDGQRRYRTEVIAERVLPQGRRQPQPAAPNLEPVPDADTDITDPEDLPFD